MLTIYAPFNNKKSKAYEVFDGVQKSWPEQTQILDNQSETEPVANSMFWGFVGNNRSMIKKLEARKHQFWFTDTPYFGRFDNNNLKPDNHYWRICKNGIHASYIKMCKSDRFDKFGIKIKAPDFKGSYVLVCPSSPGIHEYLDKPNWTNDIVDQICERLCTKDLTTDNANRLLSQESTTEQQTTEIDTICGYHLGVRHGPYPL